jgi:predicted AAA+ superfamily ATPase
MDVFRTLAANPERLGELIEGSGGTGIVVLDEIQKAPALLDEVHSLMERRVDLLAGRALIRNLHPFMAAELGKKFVLEKALKYGLIPLVMNSEDPESTLAAYASLYLKEEVQAEGLVRNIGSFARFLEAISFSHGSILNLSHVARECQVGQKTAEGFLEDLLLGHRLPVFQKRSKRALASHPKFYYFDTGVFRSLRPAGPLDDPGTIEGAALEGLVFQHLRAWIGYGGDKHTLSYWRTRAGNEVDFILYGKDGIHAIEVKNSKRIRPEDYSGLVSFGEEYPIAKRYLLHQGPDRYVHEGIPACRAADSSRS